MVKSFDDQPDKCIWKTFNNGGQTLMNSVYNTPVIIDWEGDRKYLA